MAMITPYLFFNGDAREAMSFYQSCLGGELKVMTFADAPGSEKMQPDQRNQVLHAVIMDGSEPMIMASDNPREKVVQGDGVQLSYRCKNPAALDQLFEKLSSGGNVVQPPFDAFWGERFGVAKDRFGFQWMLTAPLK